MGEDVAHGRRPRGLTAPARVQPDRHEAGAGTVAGLVEEELRRPDQRLGEVARRRVGRGEEVPRVVVDLGVGHDEPAAPVDIGPVRQLVVHGVAVVDEVGVGRGETAGALAGERAHVPAPDRATDEIGEHPHRVLEVGALLGLAHTRHLGPPVAVAHDVVPARPQPGRERRVALEGAGADAEGRGGVEPFEQPHEPPDADAAAELEMAFGPQVPDRGVDRDGVLAPGVVALAVGPGRLGALLDVDDDVDRDEGAVGPHVERGVGAVSDEVALHVPGLPGRTGRCRATNHTDRTGSSAGS